MTYIVSGGALNSTQTQTPSSSIVPYHFFSHRTTLGYWMLTFVSKMTDMTYSVFTCDRKHRCKNVFTFFYFGHVFYVLTFFYFPNVFLFLKKRWQSLERQAD